jgi:inosose dehydratase
VIQVANAPCSWGVLEFDLSGEAAGYAQVLDEIAATGYAGTELGDWGFMPTDPARLKAELAGRNLTLAGAFVPIAFVHPEAHEPGMAAAVRTAELLAPVTTGGPSPFIVLADDNGRDAVRTQNAGRIRPEHGLSEGQWAVFAAGVEKVARTVKEATGLRTVFHHHCAGYVETAAEVDKLLNLTDPELVGLCFDTGHYCFGGGDPVVGLKRYAGRIWHVHFKDCQPAVAARSRAEGWNYFESVRQGIFCELGQGEVDFAAVVQVLVDIDYDGWAVVEQDVLPGMGTPKESALRNRDYLYTLEL